MENWGVLDIDGNVRFAPVYDCGSSLAALISDEKMASLLLDDSSFKNTEFNLTSCYYLYGKRIFYHEIFANPPDGLNKALQRVLPKIDMVKISDIVDSTPMISETRKKYLKKGIKMRYNQILLPAYQLMCE